MKNITMFPRSMAEPIRVQVTDAKAASMIEDLARPDVVFAFETPDETVYVPVRAVVVMSVGNVEES